MKIEVNKPCIICNESDSELIFSKTYSEFGYPGNFIMNRCKKCGLLFNSPRLIDEEIFKLYDKNFYFFHIRDFPELQRMIPQYQLTIGLVKDKVQTQRVLEIGSAKGYLLAILKEMGWDVFGIEISATATRFARKQFGISSFTGTLEKYVDQNTFEQFPLVLALDLIEHVPDPDDFLSKVNQVITKGGYLIIVTPNGGSGNLDTLNSNWSGFNPFHINLFSKDNLAVLLLKHGFQIEKVFSYNNARLASSPDCKTDKPEYFDSLKNLAKKLQLFNLIKDIRFALWQQLDALHRNEYLRQTIDQIQIQPDYFSTADSRDELANDCKGDNMVLILKKIE